MGREGRGGHVPRREVTVGDQLRASPRHPLAGGWTVAHDLWMPTLCTPATPWTCSGGTSPENVQGVAGEELVF